MRLFYIITIIFFSLNLAGFAAQEKTNNGLTKSFNSSSISFKKRIQFYPHTSMQDEDLAKDLIHHPTTHFHQGILFLLTFIFLVLLRNILVNIKSVLKRLWFNYWCLLKMLYPKHVFW